MEARLPAHRKRGKGHRRREEGPEEAEQGVDVPPAGLAQVYLYNGKLWVYRGHNREKGRKRK